MDDRERIEGGLLGLALGDALGAPHEGGPVERALWLVLGHTLDGRRRWTDDTAMALDLAETLIARGTVDQEELVLRFADSYRWSRGYGPGTARFCREVAHGADWREANRASHADGSFGNGAAMRAPVLGLVFARRPEVLARESLLAAEVTHAHPVALEGALLVARATAAALRDEPLSALLEDARGRAAFGERAELARSWLRTCGGVRPELVRERLGCGMGAHESCVTAVYLAGRFRSAPFHELVDFARDLGGDVDTVAAMAGAIWGAANGSGALPAGELERLEAVERLRAVAFGLHLVASPRAA